MKTCFTKNSKEKKLITIKDISDKSRMKMKMKNLNKLQNKSKITWIREEDLKLPLLVLLMVKKRR